MEPLWSLLHLVPRIRRRAGDRPRKLALVVGQASEEMAVDVTSGRGDRDREDRAEQSVHGTAEDDDEEDDRRVELDGIPPDLRDEERVLELLDPEVEEEDGDERDRRDGRAADDRGDRADDRPDDREQLEEAGEDRKDDGEPGGDRVHEHAEDDKARQRREADGRPQEQLAADPPAQD